MLRRYGTIALCLSFSLLLATVAGAQLVCSLGGDSYYNPNSDMKATPDALRIAHNVAHVLCNGTCGVALIRNHTAGTIQTFALPK